MLNFLNRYIIYDYNDMSRTLLQNLSLYNDGAPFYYANSGYKVDEIDFLNKIINLFFYNSFPPILTSNLLLIIYFSLCLFFSYLMFNSLSRNKIYGIVFAFLYSTSLYFLFRVSSYTTNLYQLFFFPLLIYLIVIKKWKPYYLAALVFFYLSFSSYYGFFSFLFVIFWYIAEALVLPSSKREKAVSLSKNLFSFMIPIFLLVSVVFGRTLINNTTLFSRYGTETVPASEFQETRIVYRPIEDMYNFSMRPWYFVLPPTSSTYFGNISEGIYNKIESTGYYLADDYTEREAGGSYLGWHFIIGTLLVLYIVVFPQVNFSKKFQTVLENRKLILKIFTVLLFIFLVSLPPKVGISGVEIVTPSYLVYKIIPVFRVLVRWSVVIYLLVLIINILLFVDISKFMKKEIHRYLLIGVFLVVNYFIFAINLPIIDTQSPPPEIDFIASNFSESGVYTVFPRVDFYSTFWTIYHKNYLLNSTETKDFPYDLVTTEGMNTYKLYNPEFIVVYKDNLDAEVYTELRKLNNSINNEEDLKEIFSSKFGNLVYESDNVIIYSSFKEPDLIVL